MDADGYGHGVNALKLGGSIYSLVAFSNRLDPDQRTDRVIAEACDAAFVLYDGVSEKAEVARLKQARRCRRQGGFRSVILC